MTAKETFHQLPWRHNCAQAVAYRWLDLYVDKDTVAKYAQCGGGRAPEGVCGALYAAVHACPAHADEIAKEFVATVGASRCRDIKGVGRTPCEVCVDTADRLVEKYAK